MIDTYEKLSIAKWQELLEITNSGLVDEEKNIAVIALLADMTEDEVLNLPLTEFAKLNQGTAFLMDQPQKRLIAHTYILGNMEFEVLMDLTKMTTAQYIDYQNFIKDPDNNLAELISVFLIPKGKKYNDDYNIAEVHKLIREHLSIVDAMSLSAFFLLLSQISIETTLTYSIKKMKRLMRKMKGEEREKMKQAITALETGGAGLLA
jgi:hypothetical protein